jgi:hypothetical protein
MKYQQKPTDGALIRNTAKLLTPKERGNWQGKSKEDTYFPEETV